MQGKILAGSVFVGAGVAFAAALLLKHLRLFQHAHHLAVEMVLIVMFPYGVSVIAALHLPPRPTRL
jgi:hypothetical protein